MKSHKRFARALSFVLLFIVCGGVSSYAQEKRETRLAPTGLSLEVNTKEGPLGYQTVPGQSFGGRYRRLPSSKPSTNDLLTFEVLNEMEGDGVRVKVYALMDMFREQRELIGDYLLREGVKVAVEEMARFGYEPMELTVVKVKPAPVVLPETASRVESVAVVGLEIRESNFPSYKLTLRNLSHKDISYLEIQTFKEGRLSSSKWPREEQNRPLVKAGETYDAIVTAGGSGQKAQDGLTPSPPQRIEVVTAVFGDKSYEGDPHSAARFIASLHGQKIQIARVFALLQNASEAKGTLDDLTRQASALSREARQETIEEIFAGFPGFTPQWNESLKAFMEYGLDAVRKELLSDIAKYAKAMERDSKSNSFGTWIGDLKQKYEAWLSRL